MQMKFSTYFIVTLLLMGLAVRCGNKSRSENNESVNGAKDEKYQKLVNKYIKVSLTTDLSKFSDNQQKMIPLLIDAAKVMDKLFWYESYGKEDSLMQSLTDDAARKFAEYNYGPWDRLDGNEPFVPGVHDKPLGANFYPADMSKEEFESAEFPDKKSQYTLIRRDVDGHLYSIPYHIFFKDDVNKAANLLEEAAKLADDEGFRNYLNLRAEALRTDRYYDSDMAWMDMKNNLIDFIVGPIENYEDKLYNYKSAHEAFILVKDMEWSKRLEKYVQYLPELQRDLPVPEAYKKEKPGSNAELNAYDVIYYAGDCNSGGKTIAINLPNDEKVQLLKGSRRLQLKNAMKAKFDEILVPIADMLIAEDQRSHIKFDAFFANTMFHEIAHGLGVKNTINGKGTVREALKEHYSALEEGKADVLGLYMITQLIDKGVLDGDLEDYYVTFLAGIIRSVRFGAADAHGKANIVRFNFFQEMGAFERDRETGTYRVSLDKMQDAVNALSKKLLILQGDGDYQGAATLLLEKGLITATLHNDLARLKDANIPVDVVFDQGLSTLGLE